MRIRWHFDTDVVVIGYGAAGATAAISAHDAGTNVLVLEKQESPSIISNSFMSGGSFICPNDAQQASLYMEALYKVGDGLYWTEPETIRMWSRYATENRKWLESLGAVGIELSRRGGEHRLPGWESIDIYHYPSGGNGLMGLLYGQVSARRIGILSHTKAIGLLKNAEGDVTGVKAISAGNDGRIIHVRARRAVILATGGFEFDEQMKLQYLKVYPTYFLGSPANTGDGLRMALGIGAQLWHMNCCSARLVMKFPEIPVALNPVFGGKNWPSPWREAGTGVDDGEGSRSLPEKDRMGGGYMIVDRAGRRYAKETFKPHSFYYELTGYDSQRLCYPRIPSYWIFDAQRMKDSPLIRLKSGAAGPAGICKWSADNQAELERGWIKRGNDLKGLARIIGAEPQTLMESVHEYNVCCKQGKDPWFGRQPSTLMPLESPPYYAVALWPGGPNTQGGPKRNGRAQIVGTDGSPVPGLYGAGELGSIYGMLYPAGGGNIAECIAFGRIAGEQASEQSLK
jgi:hypothetical protein